MTRRHTANAALSNGVKKGLQLKLQSAAFKQVWRRVVSVADATRQAHELLYRAKRRGQATEDNGQPTEARDDLRLLTQTPKHPNDHLN